MQVKLKVLEGKRAGKEVNISVPKFVIGRAEGCHLRTKSDAISRRHCVLIMDESGVTVRDLKSRNGVFVNGEKVEKRKLKRGDELQVGELKFQVIIDHGLGGTKRPKVKSVKEAAARTTGGPQGPLADDDISDWLEEGDEQERLQRFADPETRQLKLDETEQIKLKKAAEDQQEAEKPDEKKEKKPPGKLPVQSGPATKDSREAAAVMLKRFFNRG